MKKLVSILIITLLFSCSGNRNKSNIVDEQKSKSEVVKQDGVIEVAQFKGAQVTGVTVSDSGRVFANFPRWRKGVPFSVVEINPQDGTAHPYPNAAMNSWELEDELADNLFIAVQSVVAFEDKLYVLDTRNPLFLGIVSAPRLFVFDLNTDQLIHTYIIDSAAVKPKSYVNDLRIDKQKGKIYLTDSGAAGLIIIDIETGQCRRILDNHKSTLAETNQLNFNGQIWTNTVHSDGIALDTINHKLYYHSLTAYSLYAINTSILNADDKTVEDGVEFIKKTSAPDGMIFDQTGNLYFADLENQKINYLTPDGIVKTLVEGDKIKWADSFSIYNDYLYFTNSRINEAGGEIADLTFTVNKIKLPVN